MSAVTNTRVKAGEEPSWERVCLLSGFTMTLPVVTVWEKTRPQDDDNDPNQVFRTVTPQFRIRRTSDQSVTGLAMEVLVHTASEWIVSVIK